MVHMGLAVMSRYTFLSSHSRHWFVKQVRLNEGGRREGASREVFRKADCNIFREERRVMEGDTRKRCESCTSVLGG